ncbi:endonuclease-reverse transcriptase [Plakobranchus ocellatus]|uniref:Endonuclease-reverse transcriptase n=1 Tax=Plakobranchus ocellatus TaxID=259542 RepID=A0AAV4AN62_9GAST|nr:endonuclease-reverse transcriptase [Plakobranchus ocellatus]
MTYVYCIACPRTLGSRLVAPIKVPLSPSDKMMSRDSVAHSEVRLVAALQLSVGAAQTTNSVSRPCAWTDISNTPCTLQIIPSRAGFIICGKSLISEILNGAAEFGNIGLHDRLLGLNGSNLLSFS